MSLSENSKKELLQAQEEHIKKVAKSLHAGIKYSEEQGGIHLDESSTAEIHEALMRDVITAIGVKIHSENIQNYKFMLGTPYFSRCDLILNGTNEIKTFYFGKFLFLPENIYSWVAPAAKVRFEDIGEFDFETTEGNKLRGRLLRKDNYMIVDGKIIFMSSESYYYERTLVHQEYLSNRKQAGFQMQDIVALMEKAQDQVIRANPKVSFLIAGPAGSGKTTLALHRVAYLVQSPETSSNFPSEKIIVFVQDQSTKDYFSALLPNLGINNVQITTWVEWACKILKLEITNYELRIGYSEEEKDIYEFEKIESLKNFDEISFSKTKDIYTNLKEAYISKFSTNSYKIFKKQIKEKTFDRFDLTILLKIYLQRKGKLSTEYLDYKVVGKAKLKKVIAKEDLLYSLIIVDEAQNYLKDQIELIKSTIDPKTNSILYVGDLVQQTHLGTIRDWNDAGENFNSENKVVLTKVYRNTKQIIEYIKSLGYEVDATTNLRDGKDVTEEVIKDKNLQISRIQEIIDSKHDDVVGILVKTPSEKAKLLESLNLEPESSVKIMTIHESQGVEFDVVILLYQAKDFQISDNLDEEQKTEKSKVNKDLLYVASTRAINELYVLSDEKIKIKDCN